MGTISSIVYKEIKEDTYSINKAAEFYFYNNMIKDGVFYDDYEEYELTQSRLKNNITKSIINNTKPILPTVTIGISTLKNKLIYMANIKK